MVWIPFSLSGSGCGFKYDFDSSKILWLAGIELEAGIELPG